MKIKTQELEGAALDWAVAKCEGHDAHHHAGVVYTTMHHRLGPECHYSTDWSQAGPIIERESITVWRAWGSGEWGAKTDDEMQKWKFGRTPLIAAMRCYVNAKLGEWIELPEELL